MRQLQNSISKISLGFLALFLPALAFSYEDFGVYEEENWSYGSSFSVMKQVYREKHNCIYLGPEVFWCSLHTHVDSIAIDGFRFFGGLRLGYENFDPDFLYTSIEIICAGAEDHFTATYKDWCLWAGADGAFFGSIAVDIGYPITYKKGFFTPFLTGGVYELSDDDDGFEEEIYYLGIGLHAQQEVTSFIDWGCNFHVFHSVRARKEFSFKWTDGQRAGFRDCGPVWGGELGFPFVWHMGSKRRWDIDLEPYVLGLDFREAQYLFGARLLVGCRF